MQDDWFTELSEEQRKAIQRGLDDLDSGRVKTHAAVMKAVRDKLLNFSRKP